jgi:hypothetical protein
MADTAYGIGDPTVVRLGKFLRDTPLANGRRAPVPPGVSELLAQAICNYTQGLVYDLDRQDWIALGDWEATPDLGDIQIEQIGGEVVRMTHRVTGISVLGENHDDAWTQLKTRVRERTDSHG